MEKPLILKHQGISRQLDLVPPEILDTQVTIIGAGAIGSWVTMALAKSGFTKITIFDHDKVDVVNMSSQVYGFGDIGNLKVDALHEIILKTTGTRIMSVAEKFYAMKLKGIVVMAVDSMAVRREIFESQKNNLGCDWIIDARMGAEMALIYTFKPSDPTDIDFYERTLYSDSEATQAPCTAKSTTYCSLVLSGLVTKTVRDVLVKGKYLRNLAFSLKENDWLAFDGKST